MVQEMAQRRAAGTDKVEVPSRGGPRPGNGTWPGSAKWDHSVVTLPIPGSNEICTDLECLGCKRPREEET